MGTLFKPRLLGSLALMSDTEFVKLAGIEEKTPLPPPSQAAGLSNQPVQLQNALGQMASYRLVAMKGMDIGTITSCQKIKLYCSIGISHDELLLQRAQTKGPKP